MSAFVAALDSRAALVRGEKGSLEHKSSGDALLDLFAKLVRGMPADALKDGVACWMAPDAAFPEGEVVIAGGLWPVGIAHEKVSR